MQIRNRKLPKPRKLSNSLGDYAKYSNLGFQMVAVLLAGVFGGIKLDKVINTGFPLFTVILSFCAVIFSTYIGIKDFLKAKNKNNGKEAD
jgi:F0F1-type ATP synthase assembly protein I